MTMDQIIIVHHRGADLTGLPEPTTQYHSGAQFVTVWELQGESERLYYFLVASLVALLDADELHEVPEHFTKTRVDGDACSIYELQDGLKGLEAMDNAPFHPYFNLDKTDSFKGQRLGANPLTRRQKTWLEPEYVVYEGKSYLQATAQGLANRPAGLPDRKATAAEITALDHLTAKQAGERLGLAGSTVASYRTQIRKGTYKEPDASHAAAIKGAEIARAAAKRKREAVPVVPSKRETDAALVSVTYGLPLPAAQAYLDSYINVRKVEATNAELSKLLSAIADEHMNAENTK